jgi:cytochrome P450
MAAQALNIATLQDHIEPPVAGVPCLDVDPYSREVLSNPDPWYETLRETGDLVWLSRYGCWATGRQEHVHATFTDWERFPSSPGVGLTDFRNGKPWRQPSLVLETDPPDHTRARKVLARILSPGAVRRIRPIFAEAASKMADRVVEKCEIDGMEDVARAYPLEVFPDAIGIDGGDRELLLNYGSMVFNAIGPLNEFLQADLDKLDEVGPWIAARCAPEALRPDGMGAEIYAAVETGELTAEEAPLLVRSFLSAGVDTTVNGIGNALLLFARHPDQWQVLRDNPKLARRHAFEEVLRREAPVHTFFRTTNESVDVAGVPLGDETKIMLCMAAANRDPRAFDDPERFDIQRHSGNQVSFGAGIHACVGQVVARLEAEMVLTELATRVERIELTGDPVWRLNNALHGLESLPLKLHPA